MKLRRLPRRERLSLPLWEGVGGSCGTDPSPQPPASRGGGGLFPAAILCFIQGGGSAAGPWLTRMCGRPRGCKRKMSSPTGGSIAVMCPACWRGTLAAGPDGFRDPIPNNDAASRAIASVGFTGSSVRPIVISFRSSTPANARSGSKRLLPPCHRARRRDPCRRAIACAVPACRTRSETAPPGDWSSCPRVMH